MPRRSAADDEDLMRTCPACGGFGQHVDEQHLLVVCVLCGGDGRVSPARYDRYLRQRSRAGGRP